MKLTTYTTIMLGIITITFIGLQFLDAMETQYAIDQILLTKYGVQR